MNVFNISKLYDHCRSLGFCHDMSAMITYKVVQKNYITEDQLSLHIKNLLRMTSAKDVILNAVTWLESYEGPTYWLSLYLALSDIYMKGRTK